MQRKLATRIKDERNKNKQAKPKPKTNKTETNKTETNKNKQAKSLYIFFANILYEMNQNYVSHQENDNLNFNLI